MALIYKQKTQNTKIMYTGHSAWMKSGKAARFAERRAENNAKAACPQFESSHPGGGCFAAQRPGSFPVVPQPQLSRRSAAGGLPFPSGKATFQAAMPDFPLGNIGFLAPGSFGWQRGRGAFLQARGSLLFVAWRRGNGPFFSLRKWRACRCLPGGNMVSCILNNPKGGAAG